MHNAGRRVDDRAYYQPVISEHSLLRQINSLLAGNLALRRVRPGLGRAPDSQKTPQKQVFSWIARGETGGFWGESRSKSRWLTSQFGLCRNVIAQPIRRADDLGGRAMRRWGFRSAPEPTHPCRTIPGPHRAHRHLLAVDAQVEKSPGSFRRVRSRGNYEALQAQSAVAIHGHPASFVRHFSRKLAGTSSV